MNEFNLYKKQSEILYYGIRSESLGVHLGDDVLSNLLAPPPRKGDITNVSRTEHGTRVMRVPYLAERSLTLKFVITGRTKEEHNKRYKSFLDYITSEECVIEIPSVSSDKFFLAYQSSQSYNRSVSGMVSTLAVKFTEYNPSKRSFPREVRISWLDPVNPV